MKIVIFLVKITSLTYCFFFSPKLPIDRASNYASVYRFSEPYFISYHHKFESILFYGGCIKCDADVLLTTITTHQRILWRMHSDQSSALLLASEETFSAKKKHLTPDPTAIETRSKENHGSAHTHTRMHKYTSTQA